MRQPVIQFANKLELRYHFNDKSSYIDATTKIKCEKELLFFMRSIAEMLDVKMMIYNEAYVKEGYSELWPIAGRDSRAISIVLNVVMQLLTMPLTDEGGHLLSVFSPQMEKRLQENLAALKQQLKLKSSSAIIQPELIHDLNGVIRFRKSKTAFFEAVKGYPKITKIVVRELNESNNNRSGSLEVKRDQFDQYISKTTEEDTFTLKTAEEDKRQLSFGFD